MQMQRFDQYLLSHLLRYFYDVYFDRTLRINDQSICKVYKVPNESEQDATVGVMRDLLNCRDARDVWIAAIA